MRLAMVGTRGVPARYGGFETAVEEIGWRLAAAGHEVTVYCRGNPAEIPPHYRGMRCVVRPALQRKSLETLSHTLVCGLDALRRAPFDVVFLFNAANAPLVPLLRRRRTPVAIHVDGLESRRAKWGRVGRGYYRFAEGLSVRWADALVADARAIARYYEDEFGASSHVIAYGAPLLEEVDGEGLELLGVESRRYHLVVARFEPENHVVEIVRGYRNSSARWPLLVVGSAPYAPGYVDEVHRAAAGDERIRFAGAVWDQGLLDRLYHHAGSYVHGHSVGGTNPSLLRAMGAGAPVIALDTVFAHEVCADTGVYFESEIDLAHTLASAEAEPGSHRQRGELGRNRARDLYRWDRVARQYEGLAAALASGQSHRKAVSGCRRPVA